MSRGKKHWFVLGTDDLQAAFASNPKRVFYEIESASIFLNRHIQGRESPPGSYKNEARLLLEDFIYQLRQPELIAVREVANQVCH